MLDVPGDGFIAQVSEVVSSPIPLQTGNVQTIKQALHRRKWRRPDLVEKWVAYRTHRLGEFFSLFGSAGAAPNDAAHLLDVEVRREHRSGWDNKKSKKAAHVLRSFLDEVTIGTEDSCCLFKRPERRAELNHADRMEPELEGGDYAEVSTPATYGPEQVRILFIARGYKTPIGQNHVHREQSVDSQAIYAGEIDDSPA